MQCEDLQHNFLFWDNNSAMYKLLMDEFAPSKFLKLNPNFALAQHISPACKKKTLH